MENGGGGEAVRGGEIVDSGFVAEGEFGGQRLFSVDGNAGRDEGGLAQPDFTVKGMANLGAVVEFSEGLGAGDLVIAKNDHVFAVQGLPAGESKGIGGLAGFGEEKEERTEIGDGALELGLVEFLEQPLLYVFFGRLDTEREGVAVGGVARREVVNGEDPADLVKTFGSARFGETVIGEDLVGLEVRGRVKRASLISRLRPRLRTARSPKRER